MSFSGAPNVLHVKVNGNDGRQGKDWSDNPTGALATINGALGKIPIGAGAVILIAPGRYLNNAVRATINKANVRFQGAGPGTVLEVNDPSSVPLLILAANKLEFADLTLVNSSTAGDGVAMISGNGGPFANLRVIRCIMKGKKTFQPFRYQKIFVNETRIEGTQNGFLFGNQNDADAPQFSSIVINSDFRAINASPATAESVVVNGGQLTAMNCNFTNISPNTGSTQGLRYVGIKADNGGQILLLNCEISVDKPTTVASDLGQRVGVEIGGTTARINLTACSILARQASGAPAANSIEPNPGIPARMKANACLLTPTWS